MKSLKLIALLTLLAYQLLCNATVNSYFDSIKTNPPALYAFLKNMPKGGELHYHLAGGAYPETLLALVAQGNYCLDKKTFTMTKATEHCAGISGQELTQHAELYAQTIRAWSLKDFIAGQETSHDHFFASFPKFMPVINDYQPQLIAEVMQRAADQHELYLEIMVLPDNAKSATFAIKGTSPEQFSAIQQQLLKNPAFQKNIQHTADESTRILKEAKQHLGCSKNSNQDVCNLSVKLQYIVLREQNFDQIFAQALNGFAAAARSNDLVAVNLVQAEDDIIPLRDYHKHMQLFHFLHQAYPKVHISLHAGELAPSAVTPENLRFHIHEAVSLGEAERIGHAVDIAFENNAEALLKAMAKRNLAVEINLISNKKLLDISGSQHPLRQYLHYHVPVVLSSDDEGSLRTDLTQQYVEAVLRHGLDYPTLKMISRNAITYSFLPGKSIWKTAEQAQPVQACQELNSVTCLHFIKENEKARVQRELEKKFVEFEQVSRN